MSFAAVQDRKGSLINSETNQQRRNDNGRQIQNRADQETRFATGQGGNERRGPNPYMFCGSTDHRHWNCPMDERARTDVIRANGGCTLCLNKGHFNRDCNAESCRKCGGRHHTWLHYNNARQGGPQNYQVLQRTDDQAQLDMDKGQPSMTAAVYSPGYMVTGNPGSASMHPMYQPIPMALPNMNYSNYRQGGNGRRNGDDPRAPV